MVMDYFSLIAVFPDIFVIGLLWDPVSPTVAEGRVILDISILVFQPEICIHC